MLSQAGCAPRSPAPRHRNASCSDSPPFAPYGLSGVGVSKTRIKPPAGLNLAGGFPMRKSMGKGYKGASRVHGMLCPNDLLGENKANVTEK